MDFVVGDDSCDLLLTRGAHLRRYYRFHTCLAYGEQIITQSVSFLQGVLFLQDGGREEQNSPTS